MHELSIARDVVNAVAEHGKSYQGSRITSVTLTLGVYSGVDHEALRFAFPVASEGTPLEDAELVINTLPLSLMCPDCGETPIEPGSVSCPVCRSMNLELNSGTEIEIASFEIETPDDVLSEEKK